MTTNFDSNRSLPSQQIISSPNLIDRQATPLSFFSGSESGAVTGPTDSMILPEAIAVVEVEPSPAIVDTVHSGPNSGHLIGHVALLGSIAFGAILLGSIYRKTRKPVRVVENQKLQPLDLSFFFAGSPPAIPKMTRDQHDRALTNAGILAERVKELDSDRFREIEFISFVNWKYGTRHPVDRERDFSHSIQRLEKALKFRDLYRSIERIETLYREPIQQEFYRFVTYLLAECPEREMFHGLLRDKLEESLSLILSEKGRACLFEYFQAIETLIETDLGFTLLGLFRYSRSNHLSILTLVDDLLDTLARQEENTEEKLAASVVEHYESLVQLQPILALSNREISLDVLLQILYYIILDRRYRPSLDKFERSIALLGEWYVSYQIVVSIRQEYPPAEYRQPKNFSESIPGIELYQKYEKSLIQHSVV